MSVFHYLLSLSSHSDVQLHFAWQKERPHLEHNHVDVPVPGSGSHYLSVLSGVVCPALLSPEGGTAYKNHMMYILSKDAVKFSYSAFNCYFCSSLPFLSYWSLALGAVRGLMTDSDGLWPTAELLGRRLLLISINETSLSATVTTSGLCFI